MSAATTHSGLGTPPGLSVTLATKPPLPLLVSTVNVFASWLALIKSTLPSPLTSAAATNIAPITVSVALEPKPPLPLLVNTVKLLPG